MRTLNYLETLLFYDVPQIFVATDKSDAKYICTLVEENSDSNRYLCSPISTTRLKSLMAGDLDLREVYERPEIDEFYVAEAKSNNLMGLSSILISPSNVPSAWLPESDFFLKIEGDLPIVEEAVMRRRAVIRYRLNPPESKDESKISAEHLGQGVKLIQRLVKHAYKKSLKWVDKATKPTITSPENYELEIVSFSGGSFTIHMQSATQADLIGYSQVSRAFELIDSVSEQVDNPNQAADRIAELGGHFASTYKDLVKYISETETPIEYQWSMPDRKTAQHYKISTKQAKPLYEELIKRVPTEGEEVTIIGKLNKVDKKSGAWRMVSEEDQKEYNGISEIDLAGLTIETRRYEFICEERLEEERATGREITKLVLKTFNPL